MITELLRRLGVGMIEAKVVTLKEAQSMALSIFGALRESDRVVAAQLQLIKDQQAMIAELEGRHDTDGQMLMQADIMIEDLRAQIEGLKDTTQDTIEGKVSSSDVKLKAAVLYVQLTEAYNPDWKDTALNGGCGCDHCTKLRASRKLIMS
jgi:hypothetical protein